MSCSGTSIPTYGSVTAENSLNTRHSEVNDMVGCCRWVGGILLHSFIPPSRLVLTPSFINILWNVLRRDVKYSFFFFSGVKVLRVCVNVSNIQCVLPTEGFRRSDCSARLTYHQLIGIHSCFLPSSPSSLALRCVKIPSDRKLVESNYNA